MNATMQSTAARHWLAIETSSATGSIALACGGDISQRTIPEPRAQTERMLPLINELLDEAGMALADLDAIVFGRGPGSFTGLRVAAAVAQGLALAAGTPIVSVSSLAALAERARRELGAVRVLTCVDARMGEVYWARYAVDAQTEGPLLHLCGEERLSLPGELAIDCARESSERTFRSSLHEGVEESTQQVEESAQQNEDVEGAAPQTWFAVGSGWARYAESLGAISERATGIAADLYPEARDLLPQAEVEHANGRVLTPETALPVYLRGESAWRRSAGPKAE